MFVVISTIEDTEQIGGKSENGPPERAVQGL
jgi:hypothetical protein